MNQLGFPLTSLVLWLPALGALALLLVPRANETAQRALALAVALLTLAAALPLAFSFDFAQPGFQFVDAFDWVASWGLGYRVSVDGISLWLVLLTALLTPLALLGTWTTQRSNLRTFLALLLLLETGTIGVFVAQDMLLFYLFFEFTLIPTALLIGMFGGEGRVRAATKFFLYTFAGSLLLLLGLIGLYLVHGQQTGVYTFDIATLTTSIRGTLGQPAVLSLDNPLGYALFGGFFLGFAVKAPLWPFHTWLPQAHEEAPSDGAVDILGLLIKTGVYGMIRFNVQLFPEAARWAAPAIAVLAVISILYGAWIAFAQTDMKRLLAFSSVSHVGMLVLGVFALNPIGLSGAVFQIVNIGLTGGALFLVVGMLHARRGSRDLADFGGLWATLPVLGGLALGLVLASIGLPGLSGFIGEFAIMQGAWLSPTLGWRFLLPAVIGTVLAAAYLLRMFRLAFMGEVPPGAAGLPDLNGRERALLGALLVLALLIGLYPNLLLRPMQPTLEAITQQLSQGLANLQ